MNNNNLDGTIPDAISSLAGVTCVHARCSLCDCAAAVLLLCRSELLLGFNQLSGAVPAWLASWPGLS
jgi:hypothetical protein